MAPVAFQRRVEHLAQPVDDDGLLHLAEQPVVDLRVVVRPLGGLRQRAGGHQDDAAAFAFHEGELLLVGADDVVDGDVRARRQMVCAGAECDQRVVPRLRGGGGAADQVLRVFPAEAHATLCGVHRLGDAEAEVPQIFAERHRALPVDRGGDPRVVDRIGVGDDVRRGEGDAVEVVLAVQQRGEVERLAGGVGGEGALGGGQVDGCHQSKYSSAGSNWGIATIITLRSPTARCRHSGAM